MNAPAGSRTVQIPRLLHVTAGCLDDVAPLLDGHGFDLRRVMVGSGPGPSRLLAESVGNGLRARGVEVVHRSGLTGRLDQAAQLAACLIEEEVSLAVAVGGGRVLDTVKLAACRTGVELVTLPTSISHDGISSPVASLVGQDGSRASHAATMPDGIVVDLAAVASAPTASLRAGVGDLLSNLTACADWRLADEYGHERCDAYATMIAESAARPVLDLDSLAADGALEVVAQGLLMSGLAMAAAGTSRPCSGSEHLISHALDARGGPPAALHGAQVALGTLVAATAQGSPQLPVLQRTFARLGLPLRPEDVGLTREELADAVLRAPAIKPDRWTVLSDRPQTRAAAAELVDEAFPVAASGLRRVTR